MSAQTRPAHTRLLETLLDNSFAGRFYGAAADRVTGLTEQVVAHTPTIVEEVENRLADVVRQGATSRVEDANVAQDIAETTRYQQLFLGGDPLCRQRAFVWFWFGNSIILALY